MAEAIIRAEEDVKQDFDLLKAKAQKNKGYMTQSDFVRVLLTTYEESLRQEELLSEAVKHG